MIDWPAFIGAVTALAGALGIKELISGWLAKRSGSAQAEKERYKSLLAENEKLYRETLDRDARIDKLLNDKRAQKEYSALLRRKLIEHGVAYQDLPEWPVEEGE